MSESIPEIQIENVVGTGKIKKKDGGDFNIDVGTLSEDLGVETWSENSPHPGVHTSFEEDGPLITFYQSGKYIIRASSEERLSQENEEVKNRLTEIGVINDSDHTVNFEVSNIVCVADLGQDVNLEALSAALPLERVEYAPERFPALTFREKEDEDSYLSDDGDGCTFLVFANGSVVMPGQRDEDKVRESLENFVERARKYNIID